MSIRLLIADDHELVRSGLVAMLEGTEIEIIAQATNADEALALALEHRPAVILTDVRMPPRDGLLAIEKIREASPETQVVVFSTYDNPTYVARSIAMGAADYVLKGANRHQLTTAILRAARGEEPPETSLLQRLKSSMARRKDRSDTNDIPLTNRELQVLRHIALGLSNREIGRSLGISIETVKEHVQNILRKVDANDRTQAAVWAVRRGLI
ncbi:MAG: response regulator transcription factor [Planctomycetota bacterium]|nr:response regulator transcription factor [Planctomycetota bacterium]